jgi:hypothetical protein
LYYEGLDPFERIALFSYKEEISIPVYPWLLHQEGVNYHTTHFDVIGEEFWAFVTRDYGFDLTHGLGLEEIQQEFEYDEIMRAILLPDDPEFEHKSTFVLGVPGEEQYLISQSGKDLKDTIFLLDLQLNILFDFCLSVPFDYEYDISFDGRYLALTTSLDLVSEEPSPYKEETIVIDLQTGMRASIGRFRVVGWVVASD